MKVSLHKINANPSYQLTATAVPKPLLYTRNCRICDIIWSRHCTWKKCPVQIGLRAALQKPAQLKQPKKISAIRPPSTNQGPYISLELNILLPNAIFKNLFYNIPENCQRQVLASSLQKSGCVLVSHLYVSLTQGYKQTLLPLNSKIYIGELEMSISWDYHLLHSHLYLSFGAMY